MRGFISILRSHEPLLRAGFEHAIQISMHKATIRTAKPKPEEPDIVAVLALEGVPYIANTLRAVTSLHGIRATVSSVFCHQKPTVEFNRPFGGCELGDILLVHRHTNWRRKLIHSNALLLQAKMFSGSHYRIPYTEQQQKRLYQSWPRFKYVRSGPRLNGQTRDISPKFRHSGAQYLLIDDVVFGATGSGLLGIPAMHNMAVWPATDILYPNFSLADELIRFLAGVSGRQFVDDDRKDSSGWSTVVWDLLEHSLSFVFNRRNANLITRPRFSGDPMVSSITGMNFCVVGDDIASQDATQQQTAIFQRITAMRGDSEPPNIDHLNKQDLDEFGGVSVIVIETSGAEGDED